MIRPIHHTFGPHASFAYVLRSIALIFQPWAWQNGTATKELSDALSQKFEGKTVLFGSGREALLALLRSLHAPQSAEIIIQGFTCVALPNAIHAAGCTPVYADTDPHTLNLDPESVRARITPRTRAVICQHTFGIPADLRALREICDAQNILLIEDSAHVLPDTPDSLIGTVGDAVMLSFGRDKAISGIAGGAIITRNAALQEKIEAEYRDAVDLSPLTIWKLLLYPSAYYKARLFYRVFGIGKAGLKVMQLLHLLVPVLTREEKKGYMSPLLTKMPNACASLALWQLRNLHRINTHRRTLTTYYLDAAKQAGWSYPAACNETVPLQKFPLFIENADSVRDNLKKKGVYLEDGWTGAAVCPRSIQQSSTDYTTGSCPNAENIARRILCLPTHPTMTLRQARHLTRLLAQ